MTAPAALKPQPKSNFDIYAQHKDLTRAQFDALPPERRQQVLDDLRAVRDSGEIKPYTIPSNRTSMGTTIRGTKPADHVEGAGNKIRELTHVAPPKVDNSVEARAARLKAGDPRSSVTGTMAELQELAQAAGIGGYSMSWKRDKMVKYLTDRSIAGDRMPTSYEPAVMAEALRGADSRQALAVLDSIEARDGVTKTQLQAIADHWGGGKLRGDKRATMHALAGMAANAEPKGEPAAPKPSGLATISAGMDELHREVFPNGVPEHKVGDRVFYEGSGLPGAAPKEFRVTEVRPLGGLVITRNHNGRDSSITVSPTEVKAVAPTAEPKAPKPATDIETAKADVLSAVSRHAEAKGEPARVDEIRKDLTAKGYTRKEQDAAFAALAEDPNIAASFIPESKQSDLTGAMREGAARIGDQDKHYLSVTGVGGGANKPEPPAAFTPNPEHEAPFVGGLPPATLRGMPDDQLKVNHAVELETRGADHPRVRQLAAEADRRGITVGPEVPAAPAPKPDVAESRAANLTKARTAAKQIRVADLTRSNEPKDNAAKVKALSDGDMASVELYRTAHAGPSGQRANLMVGRVRHTPDNPSGEYKITDRDGNTAGWASRTVRNGESTYVFHSEDAEGGQKLVGWSDSLALGSDVLTSGHHQATGYGLDSTRTSGGRFERYVPKSLEEVDRETAAKELANARERLASGTLGPQMRQHYQKIVDDAEGKRTALAPAPKPYVVPRDPEAGSREAYAASLRAHGMHAAAVDLEGGGSHLEAANAVGEHLRSLVGRTKSPNDKAFLAGLQGELRAAGREEQGLNAPAPAGAHIPLTSGGKPKVPGRMPGGTEPRTNTPTPAATPKPPRPAQPEIKGVDWNNPDRWTGSRDAKQSLVTQAQLELPGEAHGSTPLAEAIRNLQNTPSWETDRMDHAAIAVQRFIDDSHAAKADIKQASARMRASLEAAGGLADHDAAVKAELRGIKKEAGLPGDAAVKKLPEHQRIAAEHAIFTAKKAIRTRVASDNNALQARIAREEIARGGMTPATAAHFERAAGKLEGPGFANPQSVRTHQEDLAHALAVWKAHREGTAGEGVTFPEVNGKIHTSHPMLAGLSNEQAGDVIGVHERVGPDVARRMAQSFREMNGTSAPEVKPTARTPGVKPAGRMPGNAPEASKPKAAVGDRVQLKPSANSYATDGTVRSVSGTGPTATYEVETVDSSGRRKTEYLSPADFLTPKRAGRTPGGTTPSAPTRTPAETVAALHADGTPEGATAMLARMPTSEVAAVVQHLRDQAPPMPFGPGKMPKTKAALIKEIVDGIKTRQDSLAISRTGRSSAREAMHPDEQKAKRDAMADRWAGMMGRSHGRTPGGTVPGGEGTRMSTKPLTPNHWGTPISGDQIGYHPDGAIGRAVATLGQDAHLEVQGDALGNVLGHLATDAITGRITAQQQLDRLKALRDTLPTGSKARRALDGAVMDLDAPNTPTPHVPAGALPPLRQLMTDLHAIPLVRRDPRETEALSGILADFAAGKTGGRQMLRDVQALAKKHHESEEGRFEVIRAVNKAVKALGDMQSANRKALYPPTR